MPVCVNVIKPQGLEPLQFPTNFRSPSPTTSGSQTKYLSNEAVKWVNWSIKHGTPPLGVFLSGYSRGGAALIDAAKTLKTLGINVECLLLFDAVDRTNTLNAEAIPSNVKICYHSRRHPNTSSRDTFGNCGLKVANGGKTTYKEQIFFCTHGGLGDAPYTKGKPKEFIREPYSALETNVTFAKDQATSQQVWNWMWANCQRELLISKKIYSPTLNVAGPPTKLDQMIKKGNLSWQQKQAAAKAEQAAYEKKIGFKPR